MKALCIIAYSDYVTDARIMRQAESAVRAGYAVDVITPTRRGEERRSVLNGVAIFRLRTGHYEGGRSMRYVLSYLGFFARCLVRFSRQFLRRHYQTVQVCNMPDFLVFTTVLAKLSGLGAA